MEIKQQYVVDGQCFDTLEQAQDYVANSKEARLVAAFAEYKRSNGAMRVNTAVIEEYLSWVKTYDPEATSEATTTPPAAVEPEEEVVTSDASVAPFPTDDEEDGVTVEVIIEEQEEEEEEEEQVVEQEPVKPISTSLFG